jgi:hypothetical protein
MIYGSKDDGAYVIEFRTAEKAISIPRTEAAWSDSDSAQRAHWVVLGQGQEIHTV